MAHVSLYRQYRPQTFSEVVGQQHVTDTLKRAVQEGRSAHAFLFSGPRGTGKTSTARILAKALNCEQPGDEPCNKCSSCLEITEGSSLDVVEIDAASHGSVDDARDIREKVSYAPVAGKWKIYIIDECHMLSPAANNALLKILEEPPAHVVFVFATTEPHKVLQTLVDRCQRYEFRAISAGEIAARLADVCEQEAISIDTEALAIIGSRAAGSVRDALTVLEQLRSFAGDKIGVDAVAQLLGSLPEELLFEAVDVVSERDAGAMFALVDRLVRSGTDIRLFVHSLVNHLRALFLVMHAPAAQEILDLTDEQLERLRAQTNRFDSSEILRLIDLANETQLQLRQAVESRLALEVALARMTRPDLHASPASLLSRLERLEKLAGSGDGAFVSAPSPAYPEDVARATPTAESIEGVPRTPVTMADRNEPAGSPKVQETRNAEPAVAPVEDGPIDIEKVKRAWPVLLEKVKRRKISFQALLLPAQPVAYQEGELVLEFGPRSRFHRDKVAEQDQEPLLEAFAEIFGQRPRIRCVVGQEPPSAPKAPAVGVESEAAESLGGTPAAPVKKDPIELIREAFSGTEVVEES